MHHSTEMRCDYVKKGNGIPKKSNELDVPGQGNLQAFFDIIAQQQNLSRTTMAANASNTVAIVVEFQIRRILLINFVESIS